MTVCPVLVPFHRVMAQSEILYRQYTGESDLPHIMALVQNELSEPYVIYTYRYFLHQWFVYLLHTSIPYSTQLLLTQAPSLVSCQPFSPTWLRFSLTSFSPGLSCQSI